MMDSFRIFRGYTEYDGERASSFSISNCYVSGLHHRHRLHLLVSPLHGRVRIDGESDHILRLQEAINEL